MTNIFRGLPGLTRAFEHLGRLRVANDRFFFGVPPNLAFRQISDIGEVTADSSIVAFFQIERRLLSLLHAIDEEPLPRSVLLALAGIIGIEVRHGAHFFSRLFWGRIVPNLVAKSVDDQRGLAAVETNPVMVWPIRVRMI